MQSKIFYSAGSGTYYYLEVLHDPDDYVPQFISEDQEGYVADLSTDRGWNSLAEMTQDLKAEIIGCTTVDEDSGN